MKNLYLFQWAVSGRRKWTWFTNLQLPKSYLANVHPFRHWLQAWSQTDALRFSKASVCLQSRVVSVSNACWQYQPLARTLFFFPPSIALVQNFRPRVDCSSTMAHPVIVRTCDPEKNGWSFQGIYIYPIGFTIGSPFWIPWNHHFLKSWVTISGWWFGAWILFSHILGIIIPND